MKRRDFLKTSLAVSTVAMAGSLGAAESAGGKSQEFYEWRVYRLKAGTEPTLLEGYLEKALVPALNKLGCKPVGVFKEIEPKEDPAVFMLIPFATLDLYATAVKKLSADADYQQAGSEYLQTAKDKPGFVRIDSWLLQAFAGIPRIEQPPYSKQKSARIFEVRTYESYSEAKAARKVDMFNDGEIDIMREVGLGPIFFGAGLVGQNLPHLTYMLSAEDQSAHKQHWKAFGGHPKWKQMSSDPKYKDTVSKIYNKFLAPTAYSQI